MKKLKKVNGLIIAQCNHKERAEKGYGFAIFTADEYEMGEGCRSEEWTADSLKEAEEWALSYEKLRY